MPQACDCDVETGSLTKHCKPALSIANLLRPCKGTLQKHSSCKQWSCGRTVQPSSFGRTQ